eukprot:CAMPEP_0176179192 /NCGR_PEP_ID=MMETSP0120_2-20121206/91814_1 /TAXON_ID=160619 /ORGANISM="Kryptoperidinium foliaceum, Strain CCMP 1326" /LENGTH=256 /DNA_ID=CAMNT_0017517361 /DNA_START=201 /DNA_END=968 /DNA_ORIENTATION=-
MTGGDLHRPDVLEQGRACRFPAEATIGLHHSPVTSSAGEHIIIMPIQVELHLVHVRRPQPCADEVVEVLVSEVAHADRTDAPLPGLVKQRGVGLQTASLPNRPHDRLAIGSVDGVDARGERLAVKQLARRDVAGPVERSNVDALTPMARVTRCIGAEGHHLPSDDELGQVVQGADPHALPNGGVVVVHDRHVEVPPPEAEERCNSRGGALLRQCAGAKAEQRQPQPSGQCADLVDLQERHGRCRADASNRQAGRWR